MKMEYLIRITRLLLIFASLSMLKKLKIKIIKIEVASNLTYTLRVYPTHSRLFTALKNLVCLESDV